MPKFTKNPIQIEAIQLKRRTKIDTREGTLYGEKGDWLITGVKGEKYPCGEEIFRKTYYPTGPDKCSFCEYGDQEIRPCDAYDVCCFRWK